MVYLWNWCWNCQCIFLFPTMSKNFCVGSFLKSSLINFFKSSPEKFFFLASVVLQGNAYDKSYNFFFLQRLSPVVQGSSQRAKSWWEGKAQISLATWILKMPWQSTLNSNGTRKRIMALLRSPVMKDIDIMTALLFWWSEMPKLHQRGAFCISARFHTKGGPHFLEDHL